ncbi:MAG TPA: hypothetical protein VM029_16195, partial [Opitutaceae bacterium]|nr:hypothetical protein [Opitutaceae bacterium]
KSTAPANKRDTEPFWKGVQGKAAIDLKKIVYGKDYNGSARGSATLTESRLVLDGLEGQMNQNPFKVNASVVFDAKQAKPYTLAGLADVQNVDVGEILRAANPAEKPALETKMTVKANFNGTGATVGDLGKNAYGRFDLTSSQGIMRYLARKGAAGQAVDLAATVLGALRSGRENDTTAAVAELARLLNEVHFDGLKMQVERGADLAFKITSLEVLSPILRSTGSGTVANRGTDAPQKQPMEVLLQLGAKGELAVVLNRLGILGDKQDEKGYQLASRTFTIGGTPSSPDTNAFWKTIAAGAVQTYGLPALQNILNRGRE